MKKIYFFMWEFSEGGLEKRLLFFLRELKSRGYEIEVFGLNQGGLIDEFKKYLTVNIVEQIQQYIQAISIIPKSSIILCQWWLPKKIFLALRGFANVVELTTSIKSLYHTPNKSEFKYVWLLSESFRQYIREEDKDKCFVIPNFPTISNTIRILMATRLVSLKRIEEALKMMRSIPLQQKIELIIVGADHANLRPTLESVAEPINKIPLRSVVFKNYEHDIEYLYKMCDIYLNCSEVEGTSGAILNALYAGKPILCSNVGTACEIVEHKKTGYIFSNYDKMVEGFVWIYENFIKCQSCYAYTVEDAVDDFLKLNF